jgi:phosphoribosylaminoimidazolecarboxamide formyltransferase/IMP cyclohydrolase
MKRALISVHNKERIVEFAAQLIQKDFEIISTSGTARLLKENNIKIKTIEELTSSPEILNGRVKTLHPVVFAGILADRNNAGHLKEIKDFGIEPFDLIVVNLYPFAETIKKKETTIRDAIEQIDIGGVSLIRAAAKNFQNVSVLTSPSQYNEYLSSIDGKILSEYNSKLASEAFRYITEYDTVISNYFNKLTNSGEGKSTALNISYAYSNELRYGENPHQKARLYYNDDNNFYEIFEHLHGKELSYINILDIDAAYGLINEFEEPACAVIKHTNPCGVAIDPVPMNAYLKALSTDNVSRFGGIIIFNSKLDLKASEEIDKIFTEIVIAPDFTEDALEFLKKKKNRRLIKCKFNWKDTGLGIKSVTGGLLVQDRDSLIAVESEMKCVTNKKPTESQLKDLLFAMKVCKHTKSNSVIYSKNQQTVGIGGGQPSRVDSSRIAVEKAKRFGMELEGSAVASDAYFPFADGLIEAVNAGAKSVIQPGGSIRDEEVIKAANDHDIAMIFTGIRHFMH